MNLKDKKMRDAWFQAEKEFGITFILNFEIIDTDGKSYVYFGFLPNVGANTGVLLTSNNLCPSGCLKEDEYSLSMLPYDYYTKFDKSVFLEILTDWGWYGDEKNKPKCFN